MKLNSPVNELRGVGVSIEKKLHSIHIYTVSDLIYYFPRKYEDYSKITLISQIKPGLVTIKATIKQVNGRYSSRGLHITEAVASDSSSSVRVIWFNQPYRAESIKLGDEYYLSGQFELRHGHLSIMNPSIERVQDFTSVNTARILPIYRETKGLTSRQIRKILVNLPPEIDTIPETLPHWINEQFDLMPLNKALKQIHFPDDMDSLVAAQRRIGFEEVFQLALASLLNKKENQITQSVVIPFNKELAQEFVAGLPFTLTDSQRLVVWNIYKDIAKTQPMNRLVEGDVGSGKTVVCVMAALMAMKQGYQVAFMAPTELLAQQHYETIKRLLTPIKMENTVSVLTGSTKSNDKIKIYDMIHSGMTKFIVGTHALIEEKVDMHNLGMVIIDEQHRFGVEQRKKLIQKAGHMPHVLSLTATPIPRSLALTLYGELDISLIRYKPHNRKPIITKIVSPNARQQMYRDVETELELGHQAFVVCPLISDSKFQDLNSVEAMFKKLQEQEFKHRKIALLHGKMSPQQKNQIMQSFVSGHVEILVSTTVIEVGVDVPNATVMIIENADRFGLAQIHQLRGRVGRSSYQGHCYLVMGEPKPPTRRLRAAETSNDGFRLANLDMEIRGPGAIYGTLQHGKLDLRIAKLTDVDLIEDARNAANLFFENNENLVKYNKLREQIQHLQAVTSLN